MLGLRFRLENKNDFSLSIEKYRKRMENDLILLFLNKINFFNLFK